MTLLARALFAALVVATFGAFFVAQALKSTPPVVQQVTADPVLSPNGDGRKDHGRVSFVLKRDDEVDVAIVDREGDAVRELLAGRSVRAGARVRVTWDGRDGEGERVQDGTYRARITLRRLGRTITVQRNIRLDTTPPEPRVLSISPQREFGPELLPRRDGKPARIRFFAPGARPSVEIWRTDTPRPRKVTELSIDERDSSGVGSATWDGTAAGRPVAPGTYVAFVQSRDRAGNIGRSVPERVLAGHPRRGERLPGNGGITVRYLAAQGPVLPVRAGGQYQVAIDARGQTYNWRLRRVGTSDAVQRGRRATGGPLRRTARAQESGLFLFEARTRTRSVSVPVPVDDRRSNRVLVVLPAMTWQGRNPVDDNGDGLPNTLELGSPVRVERVMASGGLPAGITENEGPLLAHLHREGLRYDLTTDVALAMGRGPRLRGHQGVLLAGDAVWLTRELRRDLRSFVARGGTLASLGTGSLRAEVKLEDGRLTEPTGLAEADLFGARIDPVRERPTDVSILEDDPKVQLFAGAAGLFPQVRAWEATTSPGSEAELVSTAGTEDGRPVVVAARFGRGLVVRTGIPGFATRLSSDVASAELLRRIWTLLRAG